MHQGSMHLKAYQRRNNMPVLPDSGTRPLCDIDSIHAGTVPKAHEIPHDSPFLYVIQRRSTAIDNHLDTERTHLLYKETKHVI